MEVSLSQLSCLSSRSTANPTQQIGKEFFLFTVFINKVSRDFQTSFICPSVSSVFFIRPSVSSVFFSRPSVSSVFFSRNNSQDVCKLSTVQDSAEIKCGYRRKIKPESE